MGSGQQEVGYSGLFKKHMPWNLKYSSQDFQHTSTKLGECDLKTLGYAKLRRDVDISNSIARGEAMKLLARIERQEVSNKVHIQLSDFDHTSVVCSVYEADRIDVTIMRQSYSATNCSRKCVFSKCLWIHHLALPNLPSNFIRIL